jgi:hypothetical protein
VHPSAGRANRARRPRVVLRTNPSAVTRGAVCAESRSLTLSSSVPWVSPRFCSREIPYASQGWAFDDGASVFNTKPRSADNAPSASRLTNGSAEKRTPAAHAARSNIHAGISSRRSTSKPSNVQPKTTPSALSIAA